jgi:hypothetical protein
MCSREKGIRERTDEEGMKKDEVGEVKEEAVGERDG